MLAEAPHAMHLNRTALGNVIASVRDAIRIAKIFGWQRRKTRSVVNTWRPI